ncbi:ankyrin repeat-containing domain protein [Aspergillus flavus]|uniref:Ankyrin repeat-containing domain protein n=1 Tax=Aspergillus flavus (strain ATCC 200026 / FGSC A1120 / IAM 13836 / NRRL 3357 / JCM 12722 / SRRC 167) TaxID=332952 RepID=A0A7U2MZW2_ASPFN|nr:ankyrin repeat-containing domain protein [Aspergillus flavus]
MLLIQQGFNVQVTGERGSTLLHYMANCGYAALFAVLIELNLEVNRQNDDGRTPLYFATNQRKHHFMKLLLRAGANPNLFPCQDNYGRTPILLAVWGNQNARQVVKRLLNAGMDLESVRDPNGRTPLMAAICSGSTQVFMMMFNKISVVDERDYEGRTALFIATQIGNLQIVHLLLRLLHKSRALNLPDKQGCTLLLLAVQHGWVSIVALTLQRSDINVNTKHSESCSPLTWAVTNHTSTVTSLLLEHGAKIEEHIDILYPRVLFYAPLCGHELVVNILLERGANIENTDIEGRTPLAGAARNGHAEVVLRLLEKGACPEPEDRRGKTSLLLAAMKGYSNTIAVLLPYGVNVNKVDSYHRTALSLAAERGSTALIRLLLRQPGNEVDHPDATGRTPLVWVVRAGNVQAVQL